MTLVALWIAGEGRREQAGQGKVHLGERREASKAVSKGGRDMCEVVMHPSQGNEQ